jgi:hypothetical protein
MIRGLSLPKEEEELRAELLRLQSEEDVNVGDFSCKFQYCSLPAASV